jgi:dihydrofolate reductase
MRKLIVTTMMTLDGAMQAPGGPEEDDSGGFAFGGWTMPFVNEEGFEAKAAEVIGPIDLLLGRRTYEIFAGYWPTDTESAIGKPFADATKYVCSRGRPSLDWNPAVLIEGDAAEGVAALKQEDGPELQVHGSANLAQTLIRHRLVDEYHLWVFPVVLGEGKRLFADGTIPGTLSLLDSKVSRTGVFMGTYEPAGEVVTGSFLET